MKFRAAQRAAGANYVEVAHSHMIGARNQSCGSGPFPHDWRQLNAGQLLQKLNPAYALEKAACALAKALPPLPHDWCQLHAGQLLQKLSPAYALEKAACALEKVN